MLVVALACNRCNTNAVASSLASHSYEHTTSDVDRHPTGLLPVHAGDDHVTSNGQTASRRPSVADEKQDDSDYLGPEVRTSRYREAGVATRLHNKRHHGADVSSADQGSVRSLRNDDGDNDPTLQSSIQQQQQPRWSRSGVSRVIIYDRQNVNHGNEAEVAPDEVIPIKSRNLTEDTWRTRMR